MIEPGSKFFLLLHPLAELTWQLRHKPYRFEWNPKFFRFTAIFRPVWTVKPRFKEQKLHNQDHSVVFSYPMVTSSL